MTINLHWWMIPIILNIITYVAYYFWPVSESTGMFAFNFDDLIHSVVAIFVCALTWIIALVIRLNV